MKHINNSTDFVVILSREEIQSLMACCNAAHRRWEKLSKFDKDWEPMKDMSDKYWLELYRILNPEKEI